MQLSGRKKFRPIKSSNYDIHNKCNLTCEGCYYFVSDQKTTNRRPSEAEYDRFFESERDRGVNYPVLSGGEPSLNPVALRSAARFWNQGMVYTNGVKKLDPELPFRIAISLWGKRERNDVLRGEASYDRAFKSATGDPRTMMLLTISRENIDDIREVVEDCVRRDLAIALQDFSMTSTYMDLLGDENAERTPYYRFSTSEDNLSLRIEDRLKIADIVDEVIELYPKHVIQTKALNNWVHRSVQIHDIDPETNLATDCAFLTADYHKGFTYDLKPAGGKQCCVPEFDCRDCRVSIVTMFTRLTHLAKTMRASRSDYEELVELRDVMMRYFFWDWDLAVKAEAAGSELQFA